MNAEEAHVRRWLESRGFQQLVHEPDGKHEMPDLLVDGRLAIEVRRLNQLWFDGHRHRGLEEVEAPLIQGIETALKRVGPPRFGHSYFVSVSFGRPIPRWSTLGKQVAQALEAVANSDNSELRAVRINRQFELKFARASVVFDDHFVLGAYSDRQRGGFTNAVLIESVREIIREKTAKVMLGDRLHRYPEWWLVLVDRTMLRFGTENGNALKSAGIELGVWRRLVILDASAHFVLADLQSVP